MSTALVQLSLADLATFEIPLRTNLFLAFLGVCAAVLDFSNLHSHLLGAACMSIVLGSVYFLSRGEAIGGGDIKLMAACGLLLGAERIIIAFFLGCLFGSISQIFRMKFLGAGRVFAMGPYLSLGIFLAAL